MNMRNMLLAGILFVAPCFASQNAPAPAANLPAAGAPAAASTNQQPSQDPSKTDGTTDQTQKDSKTDPAKTGGIIAGIGALLTAISDKGFAVIDLGATPLTWLLAKTGMSPEHAKTTGRIVVPIATVAAIYAVYQALEAQNNDNDDEEIFFEDAKYSRR